jgi:1-acyl-sn-glycerol-3-phosphate acyltransferase
MLLDGAREVLPETGEEKVVIIPDQEARLSEEVGKVFLQVLRYALKMGPRVAVSRRFALLHQFRLHLLLAARTLRHIRRRCNTTSVDRHRDTYHWRLVATGLCFALFGVSCLALGLIVFPLLQLVPASTARRRARVRRTLGAALRWFARVMRAVGVLAYQLEGVAQLGRPGQMILANHPTLIDVVFLLGFAPSSSCIVKQALWDNPFTRGPLLAAGYVSNSPTDLMIEGAATALREGQSVIIFPEGSRTVPGQPLHFHRGAAAIAMRAATVVTPVFIRCVPPTLGKRDPWYRIPNRRANFSLRVGADIDPEPFRRGVSGPIAARRFNEHLLKVFTTELAAAE